MADEAVVDARELRGPVRELTLAALPACEVELVQEGDGEQSAPQLARADRGQILEEVFAPKIGAGIHVDDTVLLVRVAGVEYEARRRGVEPARLGAGLARANAELEATLGLPRQRARECPAFGEHVHVEDHRSERQDHVILRDREIVHHARPRGVDAFGQRGSAVGLDRVQRHVGLDGLVAVNQHLAALAVDLRVRRRRHAEQLAVVVVGSDRLECLRIELEGRSVFDQRKDSPRVVDDVGVRLHATRLGQRVGRLHVRGVHAEAACLLLGQEALGAHEARAMEGAAVFEAQLVHEAVAVEEVQGARAFGRQLALRGAVAKQRAGELARNLALHLADLVVLFDCRGFEPAEKLLAGGVCIGIGCGCAHACSPRVGC